jgi:hypothetical protein
MKQSDLFYEGVWSSIRDAAIKNLKEVKEQNGGLAEELRKILMIGLDRKDYKLASTLFLVFISEHFNEPSLEGLVNDFLEHRKQTSCSLCGDPFAGDNIPVEIDGGRICYKCWLNQKIFQNMVKLERRRPLASV